MHPGAPKRTFGAKIRQSVAMKRVGAVAMTSAILLAGAGSMTPAHADATTDKLNATYDKLKAALESATEPKPSPLSGLAPEPGSPLEESIAQLKGDLNEFLPGGKLPTGSPTDPNLINQNPGSLATDKLNVTAAKSVLASTDPKGDPKLTVLLANTQVSGTGSATVKVPVATEKASNSDGFTAPVMEGDSIVYDVSNSGTTQQTFGASNANYTNKLPIKIDVQTWVDGQKIDPSEMVNVSGKVKILYTFTNTTGEKTQISFRGPDGELITQEKEIPIPFGGAFSITLPQQFADVNAPWAEGGVSPAGTTLAGTIMMIPPIGKVQQSIAIEARADRASLPNSSFQALPITLTDQGMGKIAFDALPLAGDITNLATAAGAFGQSDVAKLQGLVMKYGAVASGISNHYVKPVVAAFQDGVLDEAVAKGEAELVQLDQGAEQLGLLLPQATTVIKYVDEALDIVVPAFENNTATINQVIDAVAAASKLLDQYLPQIDQISAQIEEYLEPALKEGLAVAKAAEKVCPEAKDIVDLLPIDTFDSIMNTAISLTSGATKEYLINLKKEVDDIYAMADTDLGYCIEYAPIAVIALQAGLDNIDTIISDLEKLDSGLNTLAGYLDEAAEYGKEFEQLEPKIIKALDNNNCPKTPSGISNCGIMQQVDYLVTLMDQATKAVNTQMVPGLDAVVSYLPAINRFVGLADRYVPIFGEKIEAMIPRIFQGAEGALETGEAALAKYTSKADKAQVMVASYTAQLEVMNARAESGQGLPAGPAQGANTNLGAYQYVIAGAPAQNSPTMIMFGLAGILILLSAALGTVLYSRNRSH